MNRVGYSYKPHHKVLMMGCANCQYSRLHLSERSKQDKINATFCAGATVTDLGDGTVRVTSNCSGLSNIYPKKLITLSR